MRLFHFAAILFLSSCFASPARADLPRAAAAVGLAYSAVTGVAAPIDETPEVTPPSPSPDRGNANTAAAGQEKIYFFTASWCPGCKAARRLADQLYGLGFPISVVDCDRHPGLVRKYGVEGIPEFVATRDGKLIKRAAPGPETTAEDLAKIFKADGIEPIRQKARENQTQTAKGSQTVAIHATVYDRSQQMAIPQACVGGNCSPAAVIQVPRRSRRQ